MRKIRERDIVLLKENYYYIYRIAKDYYGNLEYYGRKLTKQLKYDKRGQGFLGKEYSFLKDAEIIKSNVDKNDLL